MIARRPARPGRANSLRFDRAGPWRRLAGGGLAALVLTVTGVAGYILIEDFSFFDALYQTVTTITTAGFGEVRPLDEPGRVFTLILIVLGIMVILYVLTAVMQIAVERRA